MLEVASSQTRTDQLTTITLNTIVRDFRLSSVDLLSVDGEGFELTASKAFNFCKAAVGVILIEKDGGDECFCKTIALLTSKGFLNIRIPGTDEVFIAPEVPRRIPKPKKLTAGEGCAQDCVWTEWPNHLAP